MAGGKYRSFLVHIKAISDRSMEESPRPVLRMPSTKPQGTKSHSLSTLLQRAQASKVQQNHKTTIVLNTFIYQKYTYQSDAHGNTKVPLYFTLVTRTIQM